MKKLSPLFFVLTAAAVIFWQRYYVLWQIIPYVLLTVAVLACTLLMTTCALENNEKQKRLKGTLISMGLCAVELFVVTVLINNVLRIGNNVAAIVAGVMCLVQNSVLLFKSLKREKAAKKNKFAVAGVLVAGWVAELSTFAVKVVSLIVALCISLSAAPASEPVFFPVGSNSDSTEFYEGEFALKEHDIVIAPDAVSSGEGTESSPATLKKALEMLNTVSGDDTVTVWFKGGVYRFGDTVELTADNRDNVVFRSVPGEKVYISGAFDITGFEPVSVNGVDAWAAEVPAELCGFNTLINGEKRLSRSVYPKTGTFFVSSVNEDDKFDGESSDLFWKYSALYADPADLKDFKNTEDIEIRIMHYWKDDLLPLHSVNTETGRVEFAKLPAMRVAEGQPYVFENVFEAMTEPGEWYIDRIGHRLYYIPLPDDDMGTTVLKAGCTETLLTVDGLSNITFSGIEFCDSDRRMRDGSCIVDDDAVPSYIKYAADHSQAAVDTPCAIRVTDCKDVTFENCKFRNIGLSCLLFGEKTHGCTAYCCEFIGIGGNAVNITGIRDVSMPDDVTSDITVKDCHINGYGKIYNNAIGVFIQYAKNCTVSHNEIHDGFYTAVSVGWSWGYGEHVTDGNIIEYNLIYDIGQGWLSDMGGIYTLGIEPNTVLRNNVIHDVGCYSGNGGYGGWGIYLDEGSTGILVENNLCYNCSSQGFHQHYGKDNMLVNNVFALNGEGQFRISRKEDHNSLTCKNNIFLSDGKPIYVSLRRGQFKDEANIYWDISRGKKLTSSISQSENFNDTLYVLEAKYFGYYKNGVFADPLFRDAANGDFTLADNSPATALGFKPVDYSAAGTLTAFAR